MNLKKTLFGFGAATVLSLSMMSGAMAQGVSSPVKVDGVATLAASECGITLSSADDLNFQEWTWNGDKYQAPGWVEASINGRVTNGEPGGTCNVGVRFEGLFHEDGVQSGQIPYDAFWGTAYFDGQVVDIGGMTAFPFSWAEDMPTGISLTGLLGAEIPTTNIGLTFSLPEIPTEVNGVTNTPGHYSGTFHAYIINTA